jgi:hypothetical protein
MANLKAWMKAATREEQEQLAKATESHRLSLHQRQAEGKKYFRPIKAEFAAKLEVAAGVMNKTSDGRLPLMPREDNAEVCRDCPYARRFREAKAG